MDVGATIRRRRTRQGLTLEVLARGSGVSRAMLSDVERGRRSPTVKILSQIAVGLGTTVSELLREPSPHAAHVETEARHPAVEDERSGVVRTTFSSPLLPPGLELVRYTLPAGAEMRRGPEAVWYRAGRRKPSGPFPPNPRGTLEHVTVLAGHASFRGAETEADLRVGDAVSYRLLDEVVFENAGKTACRLFLLLDTRQTP